MPGSRLLGECARLPAKPSLTNPAKNSPGPDESEQDRSRPENHRGEIEQNREHCARIVLHAFQTVMPSEFQLIYGAPVQTGNLWYGFRSQRDRKRYRLDLPGQRVE